MACSPICTKEESKIGNDLLLWCLITSFELSYLFLQCGQARQSYTIIPNTSKFRRASQQIFYPESSIKEITTVTNDAQLAGHH